MEILESKWSERDLSILSEVLFKESMNLFNKVFDKIENSLPNVIKGKISRGISLED